MTNVCTEMQEFMHRHVPADADPWDYVDVPGALVEHANDYPHLAASCGVQNAVGIIGTNRCILVTEYLSGIPSDDAHCKEGIERVQRLGAETFAIINNHPTIGIFRCSESKMHPTKALFFEKPLNRCLALGTEHTWLRLGMAHMHS
jgi:hypothetical protein